MCQLSVGCLKGMLGFFTFLTIAVGMGGIIFGTIILIDSSGVSMPTWNPEELTGGIMLGFGILATLTGIIGIIGSSKKNKCCLCIFQFSVFPFFAIASVMAFFATYASVMSSNMANTIDQLDQNCHWQNEFCNGCGNDGSLKWIKQANQYVYQVNKDYFGRTPDCIIYADGEQQQVFQDAGFQFISSNPDGEGVVSSALQCQSVKDQNNDFNGWLHFVSYFESTFHCTGFCAKTNFYSLYESNITPTSNQSCYKAITNFFQSDIALIVSWSLFAFFLLNITLSCCLCCHPDQKQKNKGENLYTRMNYYE